MNIPVILGSTRSDRMSIRVARFLLGQLEEREVETRLIDLAEWDLPWLDVTYPNMDDPPEKLRKLRGLIEDSDGLIIVSPEYNAQIPGVLKNALDHFYPVYKRKPIGIATVSSGDFAGVHAMNLLRLFAVRVKAIPTSAAFNVPRVEETFEEDGTPTTDKMLTFADRFFDDLFWYIEAVKRQLASEQEN